MDTLSLFALESTLCLAISFVMILLIKPLLKDILTETCGTERRAAFWLMFTQLMQIIFPLLVVIYFAPTKPIAQLNVVYELQQTLFRSLLGNFIALSTIGKVIWSSIRSFHNLELPITDDGAK